jgi:hypothetical protein
VHVDYICWNSHTTQPELGIPLHEIKQHAQESNEVDDDHDHGHFESVLELLESRTDGVNDMISQGSSIPRRASRPFSTICICYWDHLHLRISRLLSVIMSGKPGDRRRRRVGRARAVGQRLDSPTEDLG